MNYWIGIVGGQHNNKKYKIVVVARPKMPTRRVTRVSQETALRKLPTVAGGRDRHCNGGQSAGPDRADGGE